MTEIITYSLRGKNSNSNEYYRTISSFCDEVLEHVHNERTLQAFLSWSERSAQTPPHRREQALLEMLSLGVLWQEHGASALRSSKGVRQFFSWLAAQRKRSESLKPVVDAVRGWLGGITIHRKSPRQPPALSLGGMELLLEWLGVSGDYKEEIARLTTWRAFLGSLEPPAFDAAVTDILELANWFRARSLEVLGEYSLNVDQFLAKVHPRYRWREDWSFTGRQRVEYHLNMLGSELLNRSLREGFLETRKRVVILPPCMKARPEEECLAQATPFGEHCAYCTPGCHVNQVTRLGEKQGFEVLVMPDELKTFAGSDNGGGAGAGLGVVGVSCALTNAPGGWEMMRLNAPAQGLLLDYCGCIWHWHRDGLPTDINFEQLVKLVKG